MIVSVYGILSASLVSAILGCMLAKISAFSASYLYFIAIACAPYFQYFLFDKVKVKVKVNVDLYSTLS